ncbi:MAG: NAD(P)-dependent oxidoreductase [Nitratireductor sp.]|nr:NAD(P)-dependent oxidoreductase [Nitratireductor sp.]
MEKQRIGIAGIGLMGHGIARNILKGGWQLVCLDHPGNQPVDDLLGAGATLAATGRDLAGQCDIIIVCVTGSPQVEDILTRADGILAGIRHGALVIDCSTAIPDETLRMAKRVQDCSGRFLDAPMTRTPKEAEEGRLNLIVGGSEDDFRSALPLLQSFAENIFHAGPVGSGHKLKLLHNYVSLGFSAVLAEAAACASRGGIAAATFIDVLARGGGAGVVLDRLKPFILEGDTSGMRFSVANAHKDTGYYVAMADALEAEAMTARAIRDLYGSAEAEGHGSSFVPEMARLLS